MRAAIARHATQVRRAFPADSCADTSRISYVTTGIADARKPRETASIRSVWKRSSGVRSRVFCTYWHATALRSRFGSVRQNPAHECEWIHVISSAFVQTLGENSSFCTRIRERSMRILGFVNETRRKYVTRIEVRRTFRCNLHVENKDPSLILFVIKICEIVP